MLPNNLIKKRILVVGSNGMLGQRTISFFAKHTDFEILGCSVEEEPVTSNYEYCCCDLTKRENVKRLFMTSIPIL
jgi:dTDP-4-dehydrorhamnose reductase